MMGIVILALRRPYTFVCMALLIFLFGIFAIARMAVDIFPSINLPVVTVIWTYSGLPPDEMERRIVLLCERAFSATVQDVEHIESQSMNGVAVIKVYFQPDADVPLGVAQLTATSQTLVGRFPPGTTPPSILRFNATDVPIIQLAVGSKTMTEDEINDYGTNFIRIPLATIRGTTIGQALGGKPRLVMVDIDPKELYAKGLSPNDVSNALNAQNVILPSGTAKMGTREYNVRLNSSPDSVAWLNDLPIKEVNGATVYIRDVAHVRLGAGVQTNIVRANGLRGTYIPILKSGAASTLAVVNSVKHMMPAIRASLPTAIDLQLLADQSIFVRGAIQGVVTEAVIAGCLTSLMILLFIGSWRSTLIVATSIPLSVLCAIILLYALGQTLNEMTLGGLALAVGILVDDATVEIENINRNAQMGKEILQAIVDAASQIATPAFVASVSISIVFLPIFLLSGPAAALFRPLAMSVVFSVMASYFLSRTIVPTMAHYLLAGEAHLYAVEHGAQHGQAAGSGDGLFMRLFRRFDAAFERFRLAYLDVLGWAMAHRRMVLVGAGIFCASSFLLIPAIGQDFFPTVDGGQFNLHIRAPTGTRIEETELVFAQVEQAIRKEIPPNDLDLMLDNIGLNTGWVQLATGTPATIGPQDGDILVSLKPGHRSTWAYVRALRRVLPAQFPGVSFFFQPADIVSQVLNLGLPAPIDIQVKGSNKLADYKLARAIEADVRKVPGSADVRVQQAIDYPEFFYNIDRERAVQLGLAERDVAGDINVSLSSSGQVAPNYWADPHNGINYQVNVQTPQPKMSSIDEVASTPITSGTAAGAPTNPQFFGNLATPIRQTSMAVINHYNIYPVFDVYVANDQRDLGGVASDVDRILARYEKSLPRGVTINVRGQVTSMRSSFLGLGLGIIGAIILAYLLMAVNFQSWLDPLVICLGLPGALAGILWMLYTTGTTFNVPSLMGAIMAVGVATSNSILLVVFAEDQRRTGRTAIQAALDAGYTRLRPVCMTALAMMIGMLPMSLGLSDGGEQNAPLGRAVIGGLMVATLFTLLIVPILYTVIRTGPAPEDVVVPEVSA
jgi:multidrug efflux pump subunit AcrB